MSVYASPGEEVNQLSPKDAQGEISDVSFQFDKLPLTNRS